MKPIKAGYDQHGRPTLTLSKWFGLVRVEIVSVDPTRKNFYDWRRVDTGEPFGGMSDSLRYTLCWQRSMWDD